MSIFEICLVLLASFVLIGLGFYGRRHDFSLMFAGEQLQKDLARWRVFGDISPSPKLVADIKESWSYLRATTVIGGGVGLILMVIGVIGISLIATGKIDGFDAGDSMFFLVTFYSSIFLGFGMGGIFAVWRLRKAVKRQITYADLRQRRLSDYRNGLFRWLPLVALAETIAFSWFFTPHLGSKLRLLQSSGVPIDLPNSFLLVSIVPVSIVVVSIIAELLMARIAHLSRLLITLDSTISQRADDMLRAMVIGMIQTCALVAIASLGLLQDSLIVRSLWASGYWQLGNRPYNEISSLFFLLLLLTLGVGGGLAATGGQLGGKLSGWPWRKKQVKKLEVRQ